jgi:prepilin-type N-terminal cleavage/methylation domain-containing protein
LTQTSNNGTINIRKQMLFIHKQTGFTLIELLVVVAIIAIISVIAVALFGNATAQARNGKRLAELEQIANVLEVNKTSVANGAILAGYQPLTPQQFASSKYPGGTPAATDPQGYAYCIASSTTSTNPPTSTGMAAWSGTTCPTVSGVTYTQVGFGSPAGPATGSLSYTICAIQEGLSGGAATVKCRSNLQ